MKFFKRIIWLAIIILIFEVLKSVVSKFNFTNEFFILTVISSIEFFAVVGYIFYQIIVGIIKWRKKKMLAVSILLIVLFIFIVCEFATLSLLNNPSRIPPFALHAFRNYYGYFDCHLLQYQDRLAAYDPKLFYRLRPNLDDHYANREYDTKFITNSGRFRDNESSLKAPEIICLGDSHTMGWGIEQGQEFASQLESISGFKKLNTAVSSYGTVRELMLMPELDTSATKYIILQYCSNDYGENLSYIKHGNHLEVSSEKSYNDVQRSYAVNTSYYPGKHFSVIGTMLIKELINKVYPVFKFPTDVYDVEVRGEEQAKVFLDVLLANKELFKKGRLIVIDMERKRGLHNSFIDEVSRLAEKEPYHSAIADKFNTLKIDSLLSDEDYFILDDHIRASGHRKIALALKNKIDQLDQLNTLERSK